ncbi:hypothetical protein NL676_027629 [Syzygium grande]|nr:hypothetical protein NL676_027629 [Syzygium grande]
MEDLGENEKQNASKGSTKKDPVAKDPLTLSRFAKQGRAIAGQPRATLTSKVQSTAPRALGPDQLGLGPILFGPYPGRWHLAPTSLLALTVDAAAGDQRSRRRAGAGEESPVPPRRGQGEAAAARRRGPPAHARPSKRLLPPPRLPVTPGGPHHPPNGRISPSALFRRLLPR